MAPEVSAVVEAVLALSPADRAAVAHQALLSLDSGDAAADQAEVDAEWRDVIGSRVDDVLAGQVDLVDADEHYARLRASLAARNA
ncbi:MAG: addiction module protein [Actinobacteria bacterium]|nr:addiction module protein [Actinomycetota bacterium]